MKAQFLLIKIGMLTLALAAGCNRQSGEAHAEEGAHGHGDHDDEHGDAGGVSYKDGALTLHSEVIQALGLKTAKVETRSLPIEHELIAQVFAVTPQVLASSRIGAAEAEQIEKQKIARARLVRIDRTSASAIQRVDAIFALERDPQPQLGEFVHLVATGEIRSALAVPESAILDAASGTFVYLVNGDRYLRTAVKLGARTGGFVEVVDGLTSGNAIVVSSVNQLWLAELRLTKGGGHSD